MISRTVTAVLDAPSADVFDFLSRVENLPAWATDFARELKYEKGKPKVYTKAQLKEMKGDPKLPGYQADFTVVNGDRTLDGASVAMTVKAGRIVWPGDNTFPRAD